MKKNLNLLFDGRVLKYGFVNGMRNGIYFVAKNIVQGLSKRPNVKLALYLPKEDLHIASKLIESLNLKSADVLCDDSDFSEINAFLSPIYEYPDVIKKYPNISRYTVLHDVTPLIFPEFFENCDSGWFMNLIASLSKDDYYFTNSDYTKADFLKYCPNLDADKITTMLLSTNQEYKPDTDMARLKSAYKKYNIPSGKKYLFSLCSLESRKNLIRAVKSFIEFIKKNKIDDLVYVLGGSAWGGFIEKLEHEVPDYKKYTDKIIRAGYVADEDLAVLYSNAQWFIYTSQYEGFGMPPLEAMSCGCPVITSNNSSLPEVVGDAGIMIDYDSDEQHVAAYEKYYMDEKYRKSMAKKGLERSKLFSWDKAVDVVLNKMMDVEKKKSNQPLVSIVTPTFNLIENNERETFIQCVTSVHNQTYKNIEHIVIDNMSKDGTIDLLKEYQKKGWIKYYSEPDKGPYDGINKGILKAKGKYVIVLNADNFCCDEHAIEMLVCKAEELNADAVCGGEQKELIFGICTLSNFLIKTNVMKELGLYDLKYNASAGVAFIFKMLNANKQISMIEPVVVSCYLDDTFANANAVKNDVVNALFKNYGQYHGLTKIDAKNLVFDSFVNLPQKEAIALGSKLENSEWIKMFFEKWVNYNAEQQKTVVVEKKMNTEDPTVLQVHKYNLFDFIPLLKTKQRWGVKRYLLFGFLPILKNKYTPVSVETYLFTFIPFIYKERRKNVNYSKVGVGIYNFASGVPFEKDGVCEAEDWGCWSKENETNFYLATDSKCRATFDVNPFLDKGKEKQVVSIYVNNHKKGEYVFESGKEIPNIIINLPKSKRLHIMFVYNDVKSPADLGLSDDTRKIAIGFRQLKLEK